jgi:hypothetical protein
MKITDIVHKNYKEVKVLRPFNLRVMPEKPKWYLQALSWALSFPETFAIQSDIRKHNMDGIEGSYLMLCNHNSFVDFKVATRAIFPRRANYIVAVDGFIGRESIMQKVGCFMKRKFDSDPIIARQIRHSLMKNKVVCQVYPEARYSLVGTQSVLPDSLGKLAKLMKVPVVTLISHGHHLRQPFWNLKKRKVRGTSDLKQIITAEEIAELSVDEINRRIREAFVYDDYKYQLESNIKIKEDFRAEGLHKPLYICPHCHTEHAMDSKGTKLWCKNCKETYEMDELGRLSNENDSKFSHIPDWFEWQREKVREELLSGKYRVELDVNVDLLQNSDGFYRIGQGKIIHDYDGFHLEVDDLVVDKAVQETFGLHVEYDYFGRGDGISFSKNDDTFYMYPVKQDFNVTKLHFAVEELYNIKVANG